MMPDYNEIQRIVAHAEDCLYDVWHLLLKGDSRLEDVNKILAELENLHDSFNGVVVVEKQQYSLGDEPFGVNPLSKFPSIRSKTS
jgi:hypothetical protein